MQLENKGERDSPIGCFLPGELSVAWQFICETSAPEGEKNVPSTQAENDSMEKKHTQEVI